METLELLLHYIVEFSIIIFEFIGVGIIIVSGIIGFTKSVAKELGSRNIRANAVAPGFIITDMTAQLSEDVRKEWAAKIPLKRGGTPEDIAKVCVFLASDLSSYVTGQTIHVCGGMNM